MRRRSTEILSALTVLAIPVALALVFPYEALVPSAPRNVRPCAPSAAFVSLTDSERVAALRTAKASWQSHASGIRRQRPDLSADVLLDEPLSASLEIDVVPTQDGLAPVGYELSAPPRSLSAPSPSPLPQATERVETAPAFSRKELLELK